MKKEVIKEILIITHLWVSLATTVFLWLYVIEDFLESYGEYVFFLAECALAPLIILELFTANHMTGIPYNPVFVIATNLIDVAITVVASRGVTFIMLLTCNNLYFLSCIYRMCCIIYSSKNIKSLKSNHESTVPEESLAAQRYITKYL